MKVDETLNRKWTKQPDGQDGKSIAISSSDNIVLYSASNITKFNTQGELFWTKSIGSYNEGNCCLSFGHSDISSDSSENIYFVLNAKHGHGRCNASHFSIDGVNSVNPNTHDYNTCQRYESFIKKFDSNGSRQWTINNGNNNGETFTNSIKSNSDGSFFITGYTTGSMNSVANIGAKDVFVEKFNTSGEKQWNKIFGTTSNDVGNRINIDNSGNIYVTGYTEGISDNGSFKGIRDTFIAKLNSSGDSIWIRQLGDTYSEGNDVSIDNLGNVYIVGYANGDFDGNLNKGESDIIVVKYDSNGTKKWSSQYGTFTNDYGTGVVIDTDKGIIITGYTSGSILGNSSFGQEDIFVMKLNTDGIIQ